jgi:hypothetical protein
MEEIVENMLKQIVHDCVYLADGGGVHFKGLIVEKDENGRNDFPTLYSKEHLEIGYWVKSKKEPWPKYIVIEVRKLERGVKAYRLAEA